MNEEHKPKLEDVAKAMLQATESIKPDKAIALPNQVVRDLCSAVVRAEQLQQWVSDLQSGMYINCVYCGHRYGPQDEVPATMADALKEHIEQCPDHPMSKLKAENARLREMLGE